jgi:hypothetical protein
MEPGKRTEAGGYNQEGYDIGDEEYGFCGDINSVAITVKGFQAEFLGE